MCETGPCHAFHRPTIRDVCWKYERMTSPDRTLRTLLNPSGDRLQAIYSASRECDAIPRRGECNRCRFPDTAGCTGDDRHWLLAALVLGRPPLLSQGSVPEVRREGCSSEHVPGHRLSEGGMVALEGESLQCGQVQRV